MNNLFLNFENISSDSYIIRGETLKHKNNLLTLELIGYTTQEYIEKSFGDNEKKILALYNLRTIHKFERKVFLSIFESQYYGFEIIQKWIYFTEVPEIIKLFVYLLSDMASCFTEISTGTLGEEFTKQLFNIYLMNIGDEQLTNNITEFFIYSMKSTRNNFFSEFSNAIFSYGYEEEEIGRKLLLKMINFKEMLPNYNYINVFYHDVLLRILERSSPSKIDKKNPRTEELRGFICQLSSILIEQLGGMDKFNEVVISTFDEVTTRIFNTAIVEEQM